MKKWSKTALVVAIASMMTLSACSSGKSTTAGNTGGDPKPAKINFPEKQITLIVPYSAGGGTDLTARALAKSAEKYLGKPVMVENRTGGSGTIAYADGANAKPDGYTVLMVAADLVSMPHLGRMQTTYESYKPVAQVNYDPAAITVNAQSPWKSVNELVEYAKANPGKVKIGHGGTGSTWHLNAIFIEQGMGVKLTQVPFEGAAPAVTALLGGHIDVVPVSPAEVKTYVESGKLRTLAVLDTKPSAALPGVKTFEEATGIKPLLAGPFRGLVVPKNTPDDVVKILQDAFMKATEEPDFKEFMSKNGLGIQVRDSASFGKFMKENHEALGKVITDLGLKK